MRIEVHNVHEKQKILTLWSPNETRQTDFPSRRMQLAIFVQQRSFVYSSTDVWWSYRVVPCTVWRPMQGNPYQTLSLSNRGNKHAWGFQVCNPEQFDHCLHNAWTSRARQNKPARIVSDLESRKIVWCQIHIEWIRTQSFQDGDLL